MSMATGMSSGLRGTGYKPVSMQQFTPEQMELFKQMFSHVNPDSFLSKLASGDQGMFEQMEAPAMKQFGQLQGSIANRFSGAGLGARNSSGFNQAQNTAAADFAQQLQSNRLNLQRQALQDLMGNSQMLLGQQPFLQGLAPKQKTFWESLFGNLVGGVGASLPSLFGV